MIDPFCFLFPLMCRNRTAQANTAQVRALTTDLCAEFLEKTEAEDLTNDEYVELAEQYRMKAMNVLSDNGITI